MEIVLTRHTSVDVPLGTCYGWTDVAVKDTFEEEATVVRQRLKQYEPFDAVFSSPLTRARKLADFCGYTNHVTDDRLKEMNMGEWEMQRYDDIDDPNLQRWYENFVKIAPTGGESFDDLYARVASFLDEIRQRDYCRVAVFAHGGVLLCAGIYAGLFTVNECMENHAPYGGSLVFSY